MSASLRPIKLMVQDGAVTLGDGEEFTVGEVISLGSGSLRLRKTPKEGLHAAVFTRRGKFIHAVKLDRDGRYLIRPRSGQYLRKRGRKRSGNNGSDTGSVPVHPVQLPDTKKEQVTESSDGEKVPGDSFFRRLFLYLFPSLANSRS